MSEHCPRCGKPRLEGSLDCPYCGIVYARFDPHRSHTPPPPAATREEGPGEPPAATPDDIYQGPAVDGGDLYEGPLLGEEPGPLPAGRGAAPVAAGGGSVPEGEPAGRLGKLLVDNVNLSIVGAVILYGLVSFIWNTQLLVVQDDFDSAAVRLFQLSGLPTPEDLDEGGVFRFVGRDYVWFLGDEGSIVLLHHRGGLASPRTGPEMREQFKGWIKEFDPQARVVGRRQATLGGFGGFGGETVEVEILALGPEEEAVANVALATFVAKDQRSALLLIAAPRGEFNASYRLFLQ